VGGRESTLPPDFSQQASSVTLGVGVQEGICWSRPTGALIWEHEDLGEW
jgi:hypothetical protein